MTAAAPLPADVDRDHLLAILEARDAIGGFVAHLDEAIGGWIGAHVWPELVFPAVDHDDALYAAPWLAQIGQAFARRLLVLDDVRALHEARELHLRCQLGCVTLFFQHAA